MTSVQSRRGQLSGNKTTIFVLTPGALQKNDINGKAGFLCVVL